MKKEEPVEMGLQKKMREQQKFMELAKRLRNTTDPKEAKRLGDKLGRMIFQS
jgi:hypothetical protein